MSDPLELVQDLRSFRELVAEMAEKLPLESGSYGYTDEEFRSSWLARAAELLVIGPNTPPSPQQLAGDLYRAYAAQIGVEEPYASTFRWEDLGPASRAAWEAAARVALGLEKAPAEPEPDPRAEAPSRFWILDKRMGRDGWRPGLHRSRPDHSKTVCYLPIVAEDVERDEDYVGWAPPWIRCATCFTGWAPS